MGFRTRSRWGFKYSYVASVPFTLGLAAMGRAEKGLSCIIKTCTGSEAARATEHGGTKRFTQQLAPPVEVAASALCRRRKNHVPFV